MSKLKFEKKTTLVIASALIGVFLLVPAISPTQVLTTGPSPQSDTSGNIGATTPRLDMANMNMNQHYNEVSQTLMDSFVQKAYATGTFKHFTLIASEGVTTLPTGDKISVFSFNGSVQAPTLRVTQGDVVQVTIVNPSDNGDVHSIDFHGSQLSAVPNFAAVPPGSSRDLTFVAVNPGVWAYHCEANNVFELWEHPMKGMAGMMIVDPSKGYTGFDTNNGVTGKVMHVAPEAREFA